MQLPKIKHTNGKNLIFCKVRRKWVSNTPEEWVRQNFLIYLIEEKKYPRGLVKVETGINITGMPLRSDIVIFQKTGAPWMLVECKAPTIKITQKVFDQIGKYNFKFKAQFLVLTNGKKHFCAKILPDEKKIQFLGSLPEWNRNDGMIE